MKRNHSPAKADTAFTVLASENNTNSRYKMVTQKERSGREKSVRNTTDRILRTTAGAVTQAIDTSNRDPSEQVYSVALDDSATPEPIDSFAEAPEDDSISTVSALPTDVEAVTTTPLQSDSETIGVVSEIPETASISVVSEIPEAVSISVVSDVLQITNEMHESSSSILESEVPTASPFVSHTPDAIPVVQESVLAPVAVSLYSFPNSPVQGVMLTTPLDETYLKTTNAGVIHTVHVGGANNLMIHNGYLTDLMSNDYGWKNVTWMLYADKELTIPLSEITLVGNRNRVSLLSVISMPVQREMLPESGQYEQVPEFHVAHLEGPNVILQVSSPIENSRISFVGVHDQSIFGHATVTKDPSGEMTSVSVGINPVNSTGDYNLMMTGLDGRTFGRVLLHWDDVTKKLSLADGEKAWSPPESLQPSIDIAVSVLHTNLIDPLATDPSFIASQQEILRLAAASIPGMHENFADVFFRAHPEWAPELRSQLNRSELQQFSDTYGIMYKSYGILQDVIGGLLLRGASVLAQIRNGGNETALRSEFEKIAESICTGQALSYLASINFRIPKGAEILEAAKIASQQIMNELIAIKEKDRLYAIIQQEKSLSPTFAGSGVASASSTQLAAEKRIQEIRAAQAGLPMYSIDGTTEIGRGGVLFSDAGSPSLHLVAGTNNVLPDLTSYRRLSDIQTSLSAASSIYQYGLVGGEGKVDDESVPLTPNGHSVMTFTLSERMMVNLSMAASTMGEIGGVLLNSSKPDIDFTLRGKENAVVLSSAHKGVSGESISTMLEAGTYYLTVADSTSYQGYSTEELHSIHLPEIPIDLEFTKFNSANIEGKISIEGREAVMPVSMRVAEFFANGQRKGSIDVNKLDPKKPVWVVIHGMGGNERGIMKQVAYELTQSTGDMLQVVTIDWEAAADPLLITDDAPWTEAVGQWAAQQLLAAGFSPESINVAGHSHGTYVGYALAKEVMNLSPNHQINALVALDAAGNFPPLSQFVVGDMSFAEVSANSLALEGSQLAGSNALAATADVYLKVDAGEQSHTFTPIQQHYLPVSTFANLLRAGRVLPHDMPINLTLPEIMKPIEHQTLKLSLDISGKNEGSIIVDVREAVDEYGVKYLNAAPTEIVQRPLGQTENKPWNITNSNLILQQG